MTPGPTQMLRVINDAGVDPDLVKRMELAAQIEVNAAVRRSWTAVPNIAWTSDPAVPAWPVSLEPVSVWPSVTPFWATTWGFHSTTADGSTPTAYVRWNAYPSEGEYIFSHEVIEMMVDPLVGRQGPEVCDPVPWQGTTLEGVAIANWVKPNGTPWFTTSLQ